MNSYFPYENQRLFGWFPIPSRYASWAELILIQVRNFYLLLIMIMIISGINS